MKKNRLLMLVIAVLALFILGILVYYLPPIHSRLAWRVDETILRVRYALNPPEAAIFIPAQSTRQESRTLPAPMVYTATPVTDPGIRNPAASPTLPGPTETPLPTSTPTLIATPLPGQVALKGVRYEDQHGRFNYCAPANLAMALSYWGWDGDRDVVGPLLKPDPKDKNVMPYEMVETVQDITDLRAIERVGGDLELIKRFVAAGFPVLVEKGTYLTDLTGVKSWMGHYEVITGYSDPQGFFIAQDSFVGPDFEVAYDVMEKGWRAFNHTYLIIYPPDKDAQVLALLGPDADVQTNYQRAAQKASDEIFALQGIDKYFAWFNRGTNLRLLQDFAGAAEAYDQAFQVYPAIPEAERPWRMLWYQTGPYFAYFYAGRYWDVLNLADATLNNMQSEKNIEETYYWRGMAKAALGDTAGASEDYQTALKYHPGFEPATYQLEQLGISP